MYPTVESKDLQFFSICTIVKYEFKSISKMNEIDDLNFITFIDGNNFTQVIFSKQTRFEER